METTRIVNLSFQIWGSVLSILIMLCLFTAKKYKMKGEKLYLLMLGFNMGAMVMDALALLFRGKEGLLAWICVRAFNYLQFALGNLLPLIFVLYLKEYIEEAANIKVNKKYATVSLAFTVLYECLITVNLFFPFFYTISDDNIYSRLPLYPVMYIPAFAALFVALLMLFRHWKSIKINAAIAFLIYELIPGVSLVGSLMFYGITFSYIGTTAAITVLFLYLQFEREQRLIEKIAAHQAEQLRDYEKLVNEGIKVAMEGETPDENIKTLIRYLGEMLGGNRSFIFERNENNEDINTYEWCADGIEPQKENLQKIPSGTFKPLYEAIQKKDAVIVGKLSDVLGDSPAQKDNTDNENDSKFVVFPLRDKQRIVGFFGIDNPIEEIISMPQDIFEIISNFFVSMFKKRDLIRQLQALSFTDAATGAQNRLAMYSYFQTLKDKKNIGVMFGDITGLKEANDTRGHSSGDDLIRNTYRCIANTFGAANTFRIGGDEFVVLCSGFSKIEFEEKVDAVRKALQEKEIVLAIGTEWRTWVAETVNQTLMPAERMMYEEKNKWYKTSGKEKRRV